MFLFIPYKPRKSVNILYDNLTTNRPMFIPILRHHMFDLKPVWNIFVFTFSAPQRQFYPLQYHPESGLPQSAI